MAAADKDEKAAPAAAADAASGVAGYIDAVSDRFVAALEKQNLPYVTPVELAGLRDQLQDYLGRRVKTSVDGPSRAALLEAIDQFVSRRFSGRNSYATFRTNFNSLQWQLWTATQRPELTADELKERDRQREWMFAYIRGLPITDNEREFPQRQHQARLQALEHDVFDNRLIPFFHDPMSAPEFEWFQQRVQAPGQFGLTGSVSAIFRAAVIVRSASLLQALAAGILARRVRSTGRREYARFLLFLFHGTQHRQEELAGRPPEKRQA